MSFRQFGGLTYASKHNIVSSNYNTSNNLLIPNYFGQPNSIVNFLSDISGNIILYGNLTITENVHVDLNVDISGNTTIGGTLDVSNNAFFYSNVTVSDNLTIGNNVNVNNNVDISGNATIGGTLDVSNSAFFNSNVNVKNNVDISGNASIGGTLDVYNNAFFYGNVTVSDNVIIDNNVNVKNIDISGNATIGGTLDVSNNAFFYGNVTVSDNLTIDNNVNVKNNVDISGNASISGTLNISGSITGNTGSFNYLTSSNNTYLATTNGTKVGIGKINPAYTLDVNGSLGVSGDISFNNLPTCSQTPTTSQQLITKGYADATYSTSGNILDASNTFTGTNTFTRPILAQGGITGATGSFTNLITTTNYGSTTSNPSFLVKDTSNSHSLAIIPNAVNSAYNSIVQAGNTAIIAQGGSNSQTITIAPWSSNASGIRISPSSVIIGAGGTGSMPLAYLQSNGVTGQNLIVGTTNLVTGPLSVSQQFSCQGGITGPTGSFTDLISTNMIKAPGGITGAAGSFTSVNSYGSITTSGNVVASNATYLGRNPPQSLINLNNQSGLYVGWNQNGGITETYLGETDFVNCRGPTGGGAGVGGFNFYNIFNGATASSPIVAFNNVGNISCQGGITGPTGSFTDLIVTDTIKVSGGITGPTGSFTYLLVNGVEINGGNSSSTGSFDYLTSSNNTYLATTTGGVAIGKNTITPNYVLDISGNIIIRGKTTSTSFNTTSDYRIKSDIQMLNNTHTVDKLIPVTYLNNITNKPDFGLIAHEVQEHFPFIVNGEKDANDYQSVNYISLIPILIKEIQELKKEIKLLKKI